MLTDKTKADLYELLGQNADIMQQISDLLKASSVDVELGDDAESVDAYLSGDDVAIESKPNIGGLDLQTELIFQDNFDGDLSNWLQDDFTNDAENRTGYKHLELDGTINMDLDWIKVPGRWAALVNDHRDKVQFIRDNQLILKGHAVKAPNPYRKNFVTADGREQLYGDYLLYSAWLQLTANIDLVPGTITEIRADFSKMVMGGHRFSFWFMPLDGNAYDDDISECEIDIEYENPQRYSHDFGKCVLSKVVAGDAGDTPNALVNVYKKNGIDLREGFHDHTIIRHLDGSITWLCDGCETNHDDRAITMSAKLYLTREMNSGCKNPRWSTVQPHESEMDGPHQPPDAGLTGRSVSDDLDLIDKDEVIIDSVSVYKIIESDS